MEAGKQERIKAVAKRVADCRKELEDIRGDISSSEWKKVRDSLTSAISFLNRADKQITDLSPIQGQMNLFDFLEEKEQSEEEEPER